MGEENEHSRDKDEADFKSLVFALDVEHHLENYKKLFPEDFITEDEIPQELVAQPETLEEVEEMISWLKRQGMG